MIDVEGCSLESAKDREEPSARGLGAAVGGRLTVRKRRDTGAAGQRTGAEAGGSVVRRVGRELVACRQAARRERVRIRANPLFTIDTSSVSWGPEPSARARAGSGTDCGSAPPSTRSGSPARRTPSALRTRAALANYESSLILRLLLEEVANALFRRRVSEARGSVIEWVRAFLATQRKEIRVRDLDVAAFVIVSAAEGVALNASAELYRTRVADELATLFTRYLTAA